MAHDEGFEVDHAALGAVVKDLRDGASRCDRLSGRMPEAVDAGFSTDVVNGALTRVSKLALVLAQQADIIASKVNVAQGSYAEIENTHEGQLRLQEQRMAERGHLHQLPDGSPRPIDDITRDMNRERNVADHGHPGERAPRQPEGKYRSQPVAPPTGPTPAPPTGPTG